MRQEEILEGFQGNFLHNVEPGDKIVNDKIVNHDLGVAAANLAHSKGISFSQAKKEVSKYYGDSLFNDKDLEKSVGELWSKRQF